MLISSWYATPTFLRILEKEHLFETKEIPLKKECLSVYHFYKKVNLEQFRSRETNYMVDNTLTHVSLFFSQDWKAQAQKDLPPHSFTRVKSFLWTEREAWAEHVWSV